MGSSPSTVLLDSSPMVQNSQYSMLAFPAPFNQDEMDALFVDQETFSMITEAIQQHWIKGINVQFYQDQRGGGFKLKGRPFGFNGMNSSAHAMRMARLMLTIIEGMMRRGWNPRAGINFYRLSRCDSFLFSREARQDVEVRLSALDLNSSDQIHLLNFSESVFEGVAQIVSDCWPAGVKRRKTYSNFTDHKIITKGYPWRSNYIREDLANSRTMLLEILRLLYKRGFVILLACHQQQSVEEVDTIYLAPAVEPQPTELFLFGPQKHDYLFTISASEAVNAIVRTCISTAWPDGQHEDKEETIGTMRAFKMHGYPWLTRGKNAANARLLILECLRALRAAGWRAESTIDCNKNLHDVSVFLMASCPPANHRFFALKLTGTRTVKLIAAPESVVGAVITCLQEMFPNGYKIKDDDSSKFDLNASFDGTQNVVCFLVAAIEAIGFRLISAADLSVKFHADRHTRFPIDLHTLFFEEV